MIDAVIKELSEDPGNILSILESIDEVLFEKSFLPHYSRDSDDQIICMGMVISSGIASGYPTFDLISDFNSNQILVTERISPKQMSQFSGFSGIITQDEDPSTHASIVARDLGLPIISLNENFILFKEFMEDKEKFGVRKVSMDCFEGILLKGEKQIVNPELGDSFYSFMDLLKIHSRIAVHANADDIQGAINARLMSADGIQPRAEYMIYNERGLLALRKVLFKAGHESQKEGLEEFERIFSESLFQMVKEVENKEIIIRLLDPPIHEFLPRTEDELKSLGSLLQVSIEELNILIEQLSEVNPMSGNRGARLLIVEPKLIEVQIRAIEKANKRLTKLGIKNIFTINIPMVVVGKELEYIKNCIKHTKKSGPEFEFRFGSMIETPASALLPDQILALVDYISFGTNDLTAQTFAFSRGDVYEKFLNKYIDNGIIEKDPFTTLSPPVKSLMENCLQKTEIYPNVKGIAICGEQSIEPESIKFCVSGKINIISCSPTKIPLTLLRCTVESIKLNSI